MEPGRNDPCPCGSGKKYKKCCLLRGAEAPSQPVPSFARTTLVEADAFATLLADSPEFNRYYEVVRPQVGDFTVVLDSNLPEGVRARTTRDSGGAYLRLRNPVCPMGDARLIAHEIGHFLQHAQGFPGVAGANDHQAAAALNSALHDPLVDASLEEYGFDGSHDRKAEIAESRRQLGKILVAPTGVADKAHWIANFAGHLLDQEVLGVDPDASEFIEWFERRYPSIALPAGALATEIHTMGFDTPAKMMAALEHARAALKTGGGVISLPAFPSVTETGAASDGPANKGIERTASALD